MPILLSSTLRGIADLSTSDLDWLHQLIADWQVIADLSVSDLVLWARTATNRFVAVAHCRPSTGSTVHLEDVIGRRMPAAREAMAVEAFESAQILMATAPAWTGTTAVREESTSTTSPAPRLAASRPSAPEPAHRSSTRVPSSAP